MKKICSILALLFMSCTICFAAPQPTKHIVLMYKVPDTILSCQNSDENVVTGAQEFEKEIINHYNNRFIVDSVKHLPIEPELGVSDYLAMVKPNQIPFILKLNLEGSGNKTITYSNMFGATITTTVPTINIKRTEGIVDKNDSAIYIADYDVAEYHSNTMAVGRNIYSNTNTRKNTKNCIRGYIRDYCTYFGDKINKYTDPAAYANYNDSYYGNFKSIDERSIEKEKNNAYLGVKSSKAVITQLTSNGPMALGGAQINDRLKTINGNIINDEEDLKSILEQYKPGDNLTIGVLRNGKEIQFNIVAGIRTMEMFKSMKI